jgi:hypothetical protein
MRTREEVETMLERVKTAIKRTNPIWKTAHVSLRRMEYVLTWVLMNDEGPADITNLEVFLQGTES